MTHCDPADVYDDRLQEPPHGQVPRGDRDALLDTAETIARELAESHAPAHCCEYCIRDTPLAMDSARDVPKANKWEALCDAVERRLESWHEDPWWVRNELYDAYQQAYHANAGDPEQCDVCLDDTVPRCGHQQYGSACPVRDSDTEDTDA